MANGASPIAGQFSELASLTATGGRFNATKLILFSNNITPNKSNVLADLTQPTFPGYAAAVTGAFGSPYVSQDGLPHITAEGTQFQPTDATAPTVIYGWALTNTAGTALQFAARLGAPVPLNDQTQALVVIPDYIFGQ